MKIFTKTLAMALMAMMSFTVVGCYYDDDDEIARTLEGTWEGNMYTSYYNDYDGRYYDASYTEICFSRDPYRYSQGTGYWIDYYDDYYWGGRYNYLASHINWEVRGRTISVYFVEDDEWVDIYDYRLDADRFTGYIDLYNGTRQRFSLRYVASPDWNSYYWGRDYYYWSNEGGMDLGKAKARAAEGTDKPKRIFRDKE